MPRASLFTNPRLILPLAALLATLPLLLHGVSCGQDLGFHLQSWIDAASQLRHGHYPHWAFTPAWYSGEPRFVFYPPLSWLFGALLTLLLPIAATPTVYVFLTITAAGFTMHRLARTFATPHAALLAAVVYLANPYMLFNAFERSALAELLASVWIPLLLLAILRPRPTVRGIAIPFALLWLTNAPAAVMGSYTFALLAAIRITLTLLNTRQDSTTKGNPATQNDPVTRNKSVILSEAQRSRRTRQADSPSTPLEPFPPQTPTPADLTLTTIAGAALGLALPAFYLLPAAYERRFVQVAMAIIPNMRFQDNFLFTHTTDTPHNDVNATASYLTLTLLATAVLTLSALLLTRSKESVTLSEAQRSHSKESVTLSEAQRTHSKESVTHSEAQRTRSKESVTLSEAQRTRSKESVTLSEAQRTRDKSVTLSPLLLTRDKSVILSEAQRSRRTRQTDSPSTPLEPFQPPAPTTLPYILALLTVVITFLLVPLSTPIWLHLPEFAFLQFPWRLNTILSATAATALAILFTRLPRPNRATILAATLAIPLALTFTAYHLYAQGCDINARPSSMDAFFLAHHGVAPTDEYTPNNADNDLLRTDNPAYWLAPTTNPNAPAPNTVPTPTELHPTANTDDYIPPADQTISTPTPHHLTLNLPYPAILVLHLRDYPDWHITRNQTNLPAHLQRDDGLLAIALPAGPSTLDLTWHTGLDQILGDILSTLALITLLIPLRRNLASATSAKP